MYESQQWGPPSGWGPIGPPDRERVLRFQRSESSDAGSAELRSRIEAALFAADRPLTAARLSKAALAVDVASVGEAIDELNAGYVRRRSALRVEKGASGYRLRTRAAFAAILSQVAAPPAEASLSPSAMETLTVIAYEQPVTRAEIESIRGVAALEMVRQLLDRKLIRVVGEDDSLGRPFLYGTTPLFLDLFDLASLADLPPRQSAPSREEEPSPGEGRDVPDDLGNV